MTSKITTATDRRQVSKHSMAKKTGLRHMHQGTLVAQPVRRKQHPQTSPSLKWNALNSGDL